MRQTNSSAALAAVVYRSRAVNPVSGDVLQGVMQSAQARNRREAITGVLVFNEDHFFQWLEGPADGVARVMASIRRDPRHADIEILMDAPTPSRRFDGWDMRLATRQTNLAPPSCEAIEPPDDVIDGLRLHPDRAADLLIRLFEVPGQDLSDAHPPARAPSQTMMTRRIEAVLRSTFRDVIASRLPSQNGTADPRAKPGTPSSRTAELAELLIADDEDASLQLIRELREGDGFASGLYRSLLEPAARRLGDLWADDACSEFEVALGMARLGTAARLLGADAPRSPRHGLPRNVLVVPAPGEAHQLVADLDSEWLWSRGWAPQQGFPVNDRALEDLVADAWIDVLDLSLSAAFRRGDKMSDLSRTITLARRASRNAALLVVVGGRAFAESGTESLEVGADLVSPTSQDLDQRLLAGSTADARVRTASSADRTRS